MSEQTTYLGYTITVEWTGFLVWPGRSDGEPVWCQSMSSARRLIRYLIRLRRSVEAA